MRTTPRRALAALACATIASAALAGPAAAEDTSTAQAPAVQCTATVTNGTVDWGIKASWRRYITMRFNNGWVLGEGATYTGNDVGNTAEDPNGAFHFPVSPTSTIAADGSAELSTTGSTHFTGHHGALDTKLSGIKVKRAADGTATLSLDYSSKQEADGSVLTGDDAVIASFASLSAPDMTEGAHTWTATSQGTLGGEVNKIFGQYDGEAADPVTVTVNYSVSCVKPEQPEQPKADQPKADDPKADAPKAEQPKADQPKADQPKADQPKADQPKADQPKADQPKADAPKADQPKADDPKADQPKAEQPKQPAPSQPGKSATAAPQKCESTTGKEVSSSTLSWGLRKSFMNYIGGNLAKGAVEPSNGASGGTGGLTFTLASGAVDTKDMKGALNYKGTVHFTGHHGVLDITIANPSVIITGPTTGYLMLDVKGQTDMTAGSSKDFGRIKFADLTFSKVDFSNGKLTVTGSGATVTAEGKKAFADAWSTNELDPVSITGEISTKAACLDANGNFMTSDGRTLTSDGRTVAANGGLARTGVDGTPMAVLSVLALVAGALLLASRKHQLS